MVILKQQLFNYDADGNPVNYVEIAGLSTDSKPTSGLVSGSEFIEVDTGKSYVLDAESESKTWTEKVVLTATASE